MTDEQEATEGEGQEREAAEAPLSADTAPATQARTPAAPPWVADPKALEIVTAAAKSVGLDVETLANLMVDGGLTALPPSDGITGRYTLKDLGTRLWGTMQENPKHMRAKWFGGLTPVQQTAVVVVLRDKGFATMVIANEFKIPVGEVIQIWNQHASDLGSQVIGLRLDTIAGNLQIVAERAQQGAMEKGDHAAMWRIQKELTKVLQDLGIVDRAIHKVQVTHKFDEQKQAELDAMLELERKKARREEEVKLIPATVVDEIPELEEDYDEDGRGAVR